MKKRIISIFTALALSLSLCPIRTGALEEDGAPGPAQTGDSGYGTAPDTEITASPGVSIEALIAALPDTVTDDNADDVRARLDEILDLYRELTEDEQEEINLSRIYALQEALDAANAPMAAEGRAERQDTDEASVTIGGETLYYTTLEEAFAAADRKTAAITMLTDAECVHSGSNGSPLNINGGNVTLNMNEKTLSGDGQWGGASAYGIVNVRGGSLLVQGQGTVTVSDMGLSCNGGTLTVDGIIFNLAGTDIYLANAGVDNHGGTVILNGTRMTGAASCGQISQYSGTTTINNVTATGTTEKCPESVRYYGEGTLKINGGTFDKIAVKSGNYGGVQSVAELLGEGCAYKKEDGSWATAEELAALEISNVTVAAIPLTIHPQGDTSWYYGSPHTLEMNVAPMNGSDPVTYVWKNGEETLDCSEDICTVPADTPVGSHTYTCEATCDGYTLSHTFSFEIKQSGTQFVEDGVVKTFNGKTETDSFTAADTITVKAAPTATGAAPQKSAARLRGGYAEPTAGQMAVFVGDTQVSEAVKAVDGSYTMTVPAADVLLVAGGPGTGITLTAKFVGNGNMADGTGTATVNITAAAKAEKEGVVIGYYGESNLADAFADSGNDGATITLLTDVERTSTLYIGIVCTLDLSGHTITCSDVGVSVDYADVSVTIQGDGKVVSTDRHALYTCGTVTLKGGTFTSNGEGYSGVYLDSSAAALSVTGKHVTIQNTDGGYGLDVKFAHSVQLSAGTYSGGLAAIRISDNTSLTLGDLLAHTDDTRYAYFYESGAPITHSLSSTQLSGTATVKACGHTGDGVCGYTPNESDAATHTKTCLACGYTETGDCGFEKTADPTADGHTGQCPVCNRDQSGAHSFSEWSGDPVARTCTVCGYEQTAVAKVEKSNGGGTEYVTAKGLHTVFAYNSGYEGAIVTLLDDMTITDAENRPQINIRCTLNLNGRTIRSDAVGAPPLEVSGNGNVTITGNGKAVSGVGPALCVVGTVVLEGGTFCGKGGLRGAVEAVSGNLSVTGENVVMENTDDNGYGLDISISKPLKLSAGTYSGAAGAISMRGTNLTLCELLNQEGASRVAYYKDNATLVTEGLDGQTLPSGSYTVRACTHDYKYAHTTGTTTHSQTCPACGDTKSTATCSYDATTGRCACGSTLAVTLPDNLSLVYDGIAKAPAVTVTVDGTELAAANYEATYTDNINAGTAAKVTVTAINGSFSGSASTTFSIGKASLTITARDQSIPYGGSIATGTNQVTSAGLVGGDTLERVTLEASASNVPGGSIEPTGAVIKRGSEDVTANYNITYQPGALTINKSQPAIAFAGSYNPSKDYDGQTIADPGADDLTITGANFSDVTFEWSVTPRDAGTYTLTASIPETNNTETASATLTVTISRKVVAPTVTITPDSYAYTGRQIKPGEDTNTTVTVKDGDTVISASEYVLSYGDNIRVGTGTVKVTDSGSGNYQITETTQTFTITKVHQETLSISGKPETTAYGDTFTLTTEGGSGEGAVTWNVTGPAAVSATSEVKISGVGSVTVTANKAGGDNYKDAEAALTFDAAKKPVTAVVTAANKTYDGSTSAAVTASVNSNDLVSGDSITITGVTGTFSNANAGTGRTVTVDGSGASISGTNADKYQVTFPASTTADIEKAIASVATTPSAKTLAYTGEAQALVNAGTASIGEVIYSPTETGTYSTTIPTGTNVGSYTVWYKIADTDNYTGTVPVKVDVTISKVDYTGEKSGSTSGKFGMTKTYNLADLLPEGYVLGTITTTDTNSIFEGTPTVNGTALTYKLVNDSQKVNSTGTITVPVTESTNYNPFDLTITVKVTNVRIPDLNVDPITVTYTGSPVNSNQITGTAAVDGNTVSGTWNFAEGQALTNVADSGPKSVVFSPANTGEYGSAAGIVTVTITKATPSLTLTPSPATLPNGGTVTLTLTGLPEGGSATVTCSDETITVTSGNGNIWTADLPAGGASYTFTASYAGDGNHNGAEASCTVGVEKITPELSLAAAPVTLSGGGAVTLTLTGLPAGETASVTCSGGIPVTAGTGNVWTATLPNSTAVYTFTASFAGNAGYHAASASCSVNVKEAVILPDPPAGDDSTKFQLVMEPGISKVPASLQNIPALNTPEKLEYSMKTEITQVSPDIPQSRTAVYDVALQISLDGGSTWIPAAKENFPAEGLRVTLPYPEGTDNSYRFTVVHIFTTDDFGKRPGEVEVFTPDKVKNTAQGLQVVVTGLSPISVGWTAAASKPGAPSSGGGGGGGSSKPAIVSRPVDAERDCPSSGFTDLGGVEAWYHEAVDFVLQNGLMNGYSETLFGPNENLSRAQLAQILYNKEGRPNVTGGSVFNDVADGKWYAPAITWAAGNGIVSGYGSGNFGPNDNITREQLAVMLWRYAGNPAATEKELHFADAGKVSRYAAEALRWAVENGIVNGVGGGILDPQGLATRAQTAQMLKNFLDHKS